MSCVITPSVLERLGNFRTLGPLKEGAIRRVSYGGLFVGLLGNGDFSPKESDGNQKEQSWDL